MNEVELATWFNFHTQYNLNSKGTFIESIITEKDGKRDCRLNPSKYFS